MNIFVNKGVQAIIRPRRLEYDLKKIPVNNEIPGFGNIERVSISFRNSRGIRMLGSFYRAPKPLDGNPCIIYMHGNSSNQIEGRFAVSLFLPIGINVFCFDFSGCGCSEGKYVSLGHFETIDSESVISILHNDFFCDKIALWGRSMGAVTALSLACKRKDISSIVLDSPFCSLRELCSIIAKDYNIPGFLLPSVIETVREKVLIEAGFDIDDVDPLSEAHHCIIPTFFIHSEEDDFIPVSNSVRLFDMCGSDIKTLKIVKGNHNDDRPAEIIYSAAEFLCKYLGLSISFIEQEPIQQNSNQHMKSAKDLMSH